MDKIIDEYIKIIETEKIGYIIPESSKCIVNSKFILEFIKHGR